MSINIRRIEELKAAKNMELTRLKDESTALALSAGIHRLYHRLLAKEFEKASQDELHSIDEPCEEERCQECCPHNERDHGICLDCADEQDPGEEIDRAYDALRDG